MLGLLSKHHLEDCCELTKRIPSELANIAECRLQSKRLKLIHFGRGRTSSTAIHSMGEWIYVVLYLIAIPLLHRAKSRFEMRYVMMRIYMFPLTDSPFVGFHSKLCLFVGRGAGIHGADCPQVRLHIIVSVYII